MRQYKQTLRDQPIDYQINVRINQLYSIYGDKLLTVYSGIRSDDIIQRHINNMFARWGSTKVDDMMVLIFDLGNY